MTCWGRLRDWHQAGGWQQLHEELLADLNAAGALDWSRAVIGSPGDSAQRPQQEAAVMSDHYHYDYDSASHDHRGQYAENRPGHYAARTALIRNYSEVLWSDSRLPW